jgi:dedicator of cytokinesis protein 6/7/8
VGGDKAAFADLTPDFKQQHFLVGLVLGELPVVLDTRYRYFVFCICIISFVKMLIFSNPYLHGKCVNMIRNLMTCHDCDPRYADPECRARVAALYLPLLGIVMDALGQLHTGPHDNSKGTWSNDECPNKKC